MKQFAIVVEEKDNVATALQELHSGDNIQINTGDATLGVAIEQDVPFGHKLALRDITVGEEVMKYGEVIGLASKDIAKGEHVHVHNVEGLKGRGDKA
ncbi:MAG: UxaA family hydrolase [Dehalococcoidia bacterium]